MFKLTPAPTFSAPVSLTVPGQTEAATLDMVFQHKGKQAQKTGSKKDRLGNITREEIAYHLRIIGDTVYEFPG